ncbi:MAG: RidA family protein [Betaproteobacteria bacterium]|nr:RidA family protein [Betaproteobacteria bacterium]
MVHTRIRKFNTKSVWKGQDIDNDLCMAVRAGNMVFVRGQTGMDLKGKIHGINDPAAQTENAMRCLKTLLEEAGSKFEDVCKIVIYVTDRAYREAVYRVVGKWLKGVHPVSTGIIVQGLARPELLMEIDVFAVIPDAPAKAAKAARKPVTRKAKKVKSGGK